MLDKLEKIANQLDATGMHKEASTITIVMRRIAGFWNRNEQTEGPIRDFEPGRHEDNFTDPFNLQSAVTGDNMDIMGIHTVLRHSGIDPSGLEDNVARQIYQAIMGGQMNTAFANRITKFKRVG